MGGVWWVGGGVVGGGVVWCAVCGVWCVVCGVWCVVCGGCGARARAAERAGAGPGGACATVSWPRQARRSCGASLGPACWRCTVRLSSIVLPGARCGAPIQLLTDASTEMRGCGSPGLVSRHSCTHSASSHDQTPLLLHAMRRASARPGRRRCCVHEASKALSSSCPTSAATSSRCCSSASLRRSTLSGTLCW